jgi:hypothetical protein
MLYAGLDIHDKRIAVCVLGEMGRILEALPDRFEVCYEASCGYGHYHDLLSLIAARVTVAQCDAALLNGSDRITSPGDPPLPMTPNRCLGSLAIVSLRS